MNKKELFGKLLGELNPVGIEKVTPMPALSEELIAKGRELDQRLEEFVARTSVEGAQLQSQKKRWWLDVEDFYHTWYKRFRFDAKTGIVSAVEDAAPEPE